MAKKTKKHKRFNKNVGAKKKLLDHKKLVTKIKRAKKEQVERLMRKDLGETEEEIEKKEEERYLQLKQKKEKSKKTFSAEDVEDFLNGLVEEDDMSETELDGLLDGFDDEQEIIDGSNFEAKDVVESSDDEMSDEGEEEMVDEPEQDPAEQKVNLTRNMINEWISGCEKGDLEAARSLLVAYYIAARTTEEQTPALLAELDNAPFAIPNTKIFLRVVLGSLKYIVIAFDKFLQRPEGNLLPQENKIWKKSVGKMAKSFARSCIVLLSNLIDTETIKYVLQYLVLCLPYIGKFSGYSRRILRIMLQFLGHDNMIIRVRAFICVHKMATIFPYPFLDLCLKGVYFTMYKNASKFNAENMESLNFLKNCAAELYGIDFQVSYQHAYIYIRELARTLRKAHEVQDHKFCYNWRFISSLDFWVQTISKYPGKDELGDLVYPLTQMIIGTLSLNSSTRYIPLRFRCIRMLHHIMEHAKTYIPSCAYFCEMLQERDIIEMKVGSAPEGIDLEFNLKLSSEQIKTVDFQLVTFAYLNYYITEFLYFQGQSISFPEITYPLLHAIKKFKNMCNKKLFGTKQNRKTGFVPKHVSINQQLKQLSNVIKQTNQEIMSIRSDQPFKPNETSKFEKLLEGKKFPIHPYFQKLKKDHQEDILRRVQNKVPVQQEKKPGKRKRKQSKSQSKKSKKNLNEKPKAATEGSQTKSLSVDSFFDE